MIWPIVLPLVASGCLAGLFGAIAFKPPTSFEWRELLLPDDLRADQVTALMRHVAAVREGPICLSAVSAERSIRFFVGGPRGALRSVVAAGTGLITTGRFDDSDQVDERNGKRATIGARISWAGRWPVLGTENPELTSAALLGVLASAGRGERLELRLRLWPAPRVDRPIASNARRTAQSDPLLLRLLHSAEPPRDEIRMIRSKYSDLLVRAEVLVCCSAPTKKAAVAKAERVIAAVRACGGPRGVLRYRAISGAAQLRRTIDRRRPPLPWEAKTLLSPGELACLAALPIDAPAISGLRYGAGPRLSPPLDVPTRGRLFAVSNFPATEGRRLAQPIVGGLQHVLAIGPTGSGKSTLIGSLVRSDLEAGRGAFVLDLKGDLVQEILAAVPARRVNDVIVLEPARGGAQPGLKLFANEGDPELTSDLVLGTLAEMFSDSWGIRSSQYLGIGLRTLAAASGSTLVDLPALFTNERFRARLLKDVADPWLRAAWSRFLALSSSERATHVSSPLTKLEELVGRGRLRLVLGQSRSRLDFREVLANGRVVLVSLPPGLLGAPATRLLAALTLWQFFQAVEARAGIRADLRTPYFAYVDEVAVLRDLPLPLEAILERARGHGCGLTLSPQALSQLTTALRSSLLANVGTVVAFQQNSDDEARVLAQALQGVNAKQLKHLGRYEVAMRLSLGPGVITQTMTGTTLPPVDALSDPDHIRAVSGERWGQTLESIDEELARRQGLIEPDRNHRGGDEPTGLGVRRRRL